MTDTTSPLSPEKTVDLRTLMHARDIAQERLDKAQAALDEGVLALRLDQDFTYVQVAEAFGVDKPSAMRLILGAIGRERDRIHGR